MRALRSARTPVPFGRRLHSWIPADPQVRWEATAGATLKRAAPRRVRPCSSQARPTGALIRACAGSSHGTSLLALLGTRGAVPKVPRNYWQSYTLRNVVCFEASQARWGPLRVVFAYPREGGKNAGWQKRWSSFLVQVNFLPCGTPEHTNNYNVLASHHQPRSQRCRNNARKSRRSPAHRALIIRTSKIEGGPRFVSSVWSGALRGQAGADNN
jgi:hypothetical protein